MQCTFSKDHLATHDENRHKICLLCLGKTKKMFKISDSLLTKLKSALKTEISIEDHLPCALCSACKRKIYFVTSKSCNKKVDIQLPDFSKFSRETTATRSNRNCYCYLCNLARTSRTKKYENTDSKAKKSESTILKCKECFSEIRKGIKHTCTKSNFLNNLSQEINDKLDTKQKQRLISSLSRSLDGTVVNSTNESENTQSYAITNDDLMKLKIKHNLSNKKTIGIAADLRAATRKRSLIEPGLKSHLVENNHSVDEFFKIERVIFNKTKKNVQSSSDQIIIHCKNVTDFIRYIKKKRDVSDVHLKFGIDGGGGFLKVCLSIQHIGTEEVSVEGKNKRRKLQEGIANKKFKDSGVKKIFILALAPYAQENYENVHQLWNMLSINQFSYTIATDLKLGNILAGLMSHSSMYPCTWCFVNKKELHERGEFRTIGNCLFNY